MGVPINNTTFYALSDASDLMIVRGKQDSTHIVVHEETGTHYLGVPLSDINSAGATVCHYPKDKYEVVGLLFGPDSDNRPKPEELSDES